MLRTKVASALEGLRDPLKNVVCIYDTLDNILGIQNNFTEYLKESCRLSFLFQIFYQINFPLKDFAKIVSLLLVINWKHYWVFTF